MKFSAGLLLIGVSAICVFEAATTGIIGGGVGGLTGGGSTGGGGKLFGNYDLFMFNSR